MAKSEDSLIAKYFRPLATDPAALGLTDDAALLPVSSDELVITADAIVEGVHFLPDDPPETIARKAVRVNLSDLAAKGAEPAGFVLVLSLREIDEAWLAPFAEALGEDAKTFHCPLLGGDTVSTPGPLTIAITAFGRVPPGKMVGRKGASVSDVVVVTGTIGDAALGLDVLGKRAGGTLDAKHRDFLIDRYRVPQPRLALGPVLRKFASTAIDVSDGLAGDLAKLCAASGVSASVSLADIPLSNAARAVLASNSLERAVTGGDDYEIVGTIPKNHLAAFKAAAYAVGVTVTVIGSIVAGTQPPRFLDDAGQPVTFKRPSFSHF